MAQRIERTYDVAWRDKASSLDVRYTTAQVAFHDGRWSARITVENHSDRPLYEPAWTPPTGSRYSAWYGPALVYDGVDVLGNRRLIFVVADSERPAMPYPLRPGAAWSGTIGGELPSKPRIPRGDPVWVRYPTFGIGTPWDGTNPALAVTWISDRSVEL